jgi:hypothetical protein
VSEIAVMLTLKEIQGLRTALIFGVPDDVPEVIASAKEKLKRADYALRDIDPAAAASGEIQSREREAPDQQN